jgi:hypothetical protein
VSEFLAVSAAWFFGLAALAILAGIGLWLFQREPIEPDPEQLGEVSTGYWPVADTQRLDRLESETVRITIRPQLAVEPPWWMGARHRAPESRCRVPRFLDAAQATAELPPVPDGMR